MTIQRDDLKEILTAVASAGFDEFVLEIGDMKIHLARQGGCATPSSPRATAMAEAPPPQAAGAPRPTVPVPTPVESPDGLVPVTAPLLGTFYRAPAPDAPPFIEVGSVVEPDDTVCIIEVMKLMNNVRAGCRGRVVRVCVENAQMVEFGQTLLLIEPAP